MSLVARWKLDGDFSDSASGYTGIVMGDPVFVGADQARWAAGPWRLEGNDGIVVTGFMGIPGAASRTCAAWIKTTSSEFDILRWGNFTSHDYNGRWVFEIANGLLSLNMGYGWIQGKTRINTGQWVHVAVVLSEGSGGTNNLAVYVNGIRNAQISAPGIYTGLGDDVIIGPHPFTGYPGLIDDVRVYDRGIDNRGDRGIGIRITGFRGFGPIRQPSYRRPYSIAGTMSRRGVLVLRYNGNRLTGQRAA